MMLNTTTNISEMNATRIELRGGSVPNSRTDIVRESGIASGYTAL